jgi:hypothetical protein
VKLLFAILVTALLCACPNQHDPVRWGTVRVYFERGDGNPLAFQSGDIATMRLALPDMRALGPDFLEAIDRVSSDVAIEHFDSGLNCAGGAATYTPATRVIRIDPVCASQSGGGLALRAALSHELGHHAGILRHICRRVGEAADCSPVGFGPAVMNPSLSYGDNAGPTLDMVYAGPLPTWQPTQLDLDEFRATRMDGGR